MDNFSDAVENFEKEYGYLIKHAGENDKKLAKWFSAEEICILRFYEKYLSVYNSSKLFNQVINDVIFEERQKCAERAIEYMHDLWDGWTDEHLRDAIMGID